MARLVFASLITFGVLIGMVFGSVMAALVFAGHANLTLAIALTVIVNLVIWLLSPWASDFTLRWFNKLQFLDDAAVAAQYPGVHALVHQVADEYGFKAPRIGIIPDRNPTAFTYGLLRSNARVVITQGIFEFCDEDEQRAVVAHELGHIVNRDFILMTMAGMLVQILYQIYAALARSGDGEKKGKGALVGLAALVFYYIGIYLLLYLSRTREYLADAFSASRVEPRHLASALVKIAYGIARIDDTKATQSLLRSTRHLGVIDVKNAGPLGLVAEGVREGTGSIPEVMLFDGYNPWAKLVQLGSTHPLTGQRILHLGLLAQEKGQAFTGYDVEAAARRIGLSRRALWWGFLWELAILVLVPLTGAVLAAILNYLLIPAGIAAGILITLLWRYPFGAPQSTTVLALMSDPAASPYFGRKVRLVGKAIGRADPGYFAGEDMIYRDTSGLIMLDFRSMFGFLGNFFAGWKRVPKHLDQPGEVVGWFKRGIGGYVVLRELTSTAGRLGAHPLFWQILICLVVIGGNFLVFLG